MKYSIVLGTQFGDEGKGSFTNYLCSKSYRPLVIRFNGGHQAGHTVKHKDHKHIFSSFGSGTLQNVPTYWSRFCTIYPIAMKNEYLTLKKLGITPEIYIDPLCPITTPYDVIFNLNKDKQTKHGTVGVGFGTTIERQENFYKLYYQDLFNETVLEAKLNNIKNYYVKKGIILNSGFSEMMNDWYISLEILMKEKIFVKHRMGFKNYNNVFNHVIFEGAQGILLDMDFGFFPNVTRSNTTSKNVYTLLKELNLPINSVRNAINSSGMERSFNEYFIIDTYYITRIYQTRHGNGFMSNENIKPNLINTETETNLDTGNQGVFRKSILDLNLIDYAIKSDDIFSHNSRKHLVITCLDQIEDPFNIKYSLNGEVISSNIHQMTEDFENLTDITKFIIGPMEGIFEEYKKKYKYVN